MFCRCRFCHHRSCCEAGLALQHLRGLLELAQYASPSVLVLSSASSQIEMESGNDSLFDEAADESDDQKQEDNEGNEDREGEERAQSQAGSDVDSSEEEEGGNEYDMTDKFIAPEDEEEAGDESESDEEGGRRKKRKRRRREEEELDEEDFALLEEQGVRVDVCSVSRLQPYHSQNGS